MKPLNHKQRNAFTILMADDDPDDRQLTKEALREVCLKDHFAEVCDCEDLLSYPCLGRKLQSCSDCPAGPLTTLLPHHGDIANFLLFLGTLIFSNAHFPNESYSEKHRHRDSNSEPNDDS